MAYSDEYVGLDECCSVCGRVLSLAHSESDHDGVHEIMNEERCAKCGTSDLDNDPEHPGFERGIVVNNDFLCAKCAWEKILE